MVLQRPKKEEGGAKGIQSPFNKQLPKDGPEKDKKYKPFRKLTKGIQGGPIGGRPPPSENSVQGDAFRTQREKGGKREINHGF